MRTFTTRDIFGVFTVLVVGLLSLASWRAFFDVSLNPDPANTLLALLWFSLLGVAFFLGMVVWRDRLLQAVSALLLLLPSFLFIRTWYHFGFVLLAGFLAFSAATSVQDEIGDRIHFHFFRNARAGLFMLILSLSLALSSAYFASIRIESWEELVPRFSVGEGTANALFKTVAYLYPEWKGLASDGMTIDGFLTGLGTNGGKASVVPSDVAAMPALAEYLKQYSQGQELASKSNFSQELSLQAGRDQIALLAGRPVRGDEKIADVFSLAIQHKIITALSGEQVSQHFSPTVVPFILALLLFFTLLPLGSALGLLWIFFSFLLFRVTLFFGWIRLERAAREQEILLP